MPRIKRKHSRQRIGWNEDHKRQLVHGYSMFAGSDDWGDFQELRRPERDNWPEPEVLAEMSEAWSDLRDEIMAEYSDSLSRPWSWWLFDNGYSPNDALRMTGDREKATLDEMGELTAKALAKAAADDYLTRGILNDVHQRAFRRSWGWWRFTSPERRDESKPQAVQLVELERHGAEVLTSRELYIVANLEERQVYRRGACPTWLSAAECAALGLPETFHHDSQD